MTLTSLSMANSPPAMVGLCAASMGCFLLFLSLSGTECQLNCILQVHPAIRTSTYLEVPVEPSQGHVGWAVCQRVVIDHVCTDAGIISCLGGGSSLEEQGWKSGECYIIMLV